MNEDLFATVANNFKSVSRLALWTIKLLQTDPIQRIIERDERLFATAFAALYPFNPTELAIKKGGHWDTKAEARETVREVTKELSRTYGNENITTNYIHVFTQGQINYEKFDEKDDWTEWKNFLKAAAKEAAALYANNDTSVEVNIDLIGEIIDLTKSERDLLEFQILRNDISFGMFYRTLFDNARKNRYFTSSVLNLMFEEFDKATLTKSSTLYKAGLLNYNEQTGMLGTLSPSLGSLFMIYDGNVETFFKQIVQVMEKKPSASGALGTLSPQDKSMIHELFQKAVLQEDLKGVNVLAYGSHTIDKKTAVYDTLSDLEIPIYSLVTRNVNKGDLGTRAYIGQRLLAREAKESDKDKPLLIIEQAEDVLSRRTSGFFMFMNGFADRDEDDEESALENDEVLLEENPIPTLWIGAPVRLVEENVGRFLFHAEIKSASRADRRTQIEDVIKELELPEEVRAHLAKYHQLSRRQITSATRLAKLIGQDSKEQETIIKRGIYQSQRALGRDYMEELKDSVTKYSLDLINLKSEFTITDIITSLKRNPKGTLCFYGLPGAGKTQLAEYIAIQLDKPLVAKRASDLLSKWVGENEQNMAAMFREAQDDDAVLFLDEADSFLRDRSKARAEWSVTQVNELLQQMERFPGVFICATNLMSEIDQAALRRFTFKFEFLPLKDEQRWTMLVNEANINESTLDPEEKAQIEAKLYAIKSLTPGDFATVKRQCNIFDRVFTIDQWLNQLREESEAKLEGIESRKIGFGAN